MRQFVTWCLNVAILSRLFLERQSVECPRVRVAIRNAEGAYVLARCSLCLVTMLAVSLSVAGEVPTSTDRLYTLDDYFAREEFVVVSVSPNGRLLAVERKRPATASESYVAYAYATGDVYSRRSDIWILDAKSGSLVWRTEGKPNQETNFSPMWSPHGDELAFVRSRPDGRSSLVTWNALTHESAELGGIDVDPSVIVSANSSPIGTNTLYAWSENGRIFVVGRGSPDSQSLGRSLLKDLASRWDATWSGKRSARVWDSRKPATCDNSSTLYEVTSDFKHVTQVYKGSIYGVSVAANGLRIAVVSARDGRFKLTSAPVTYAPEVELGHRSDFGLWQVDVIDRSSTPPTNTTIAVGEGPIGWGVLPRWAAGAERLALVIGNEVQSASERGALLIDFKRGTRSWVATHSVIDAEVTAALFATIGIDYQDARIWKGRTDNTLYDVDGDDVRARVFPLGRTRAVIDDGVSSRIIKRNGLETILHGRASVVRTASGEQILVVKSGGKLIVQEVHGDPEGAIQTTARFDIPENGNLVGTNDAGNAILVEDTETGSFIETVSPRGTRVVLTRANEHMASIRRPVPIPVRYRVEGQEREGVLYLPTEHRFGDRPPVIVTAYPYPGSWAPLFPNYVGKVNSIFAWHWHPMLAAGFAIFVVDFRRAAPVDPSSKAYVETPTLVSSEITPAVEALAGFEEVDSSRLGFVGYSYGGYTALTLLGHSNVFSAIVAEVALSSLVQSLSAAPELHIQDCAPAVMASTFWEIEDPAGFIRIGGPSDKQRGRLISDSPLYNLQDAKTPTLLIAGELDDWGAGQDAVYMTLLRKGVDTQLVTYFGEAHNIQSPGNIRDMISREISWFSEYLVPRSGIDDPHKVPSPIARP